MVNSHSLYKVNVSKFAKTQNYLLIKRSSLIKTTCFRLVKKLYILLQTIAILDLQLYTTNIYATEQYYLKTYLQQSQNNSHTHKHIVCSITQCEMIISIVLIKTSDNSW